MIDPLKLHLLLVSSGRSWVLGVEGAVATPAVVIDCDLYADNEGHSSLITEQPACRDLLCQEPVP